MTMRWQKNGLVDCPLPAQAGSWSHAMIPTPVVLEDCIRVYYSVCDSQGRGLPMFVDLDRSNPQRVLGSSGVPLLALGTPGSFDDNGVVPTSVVRTSDGHWLMYYVGFELCTQVRYRLMTGLAISQDGTHFERYQTTAILDRVPGEELFRCGPYVLHENGIFRMWYIAGNSWTRVGDKDLPVYELKYLESADGIHWGPAGLMSLQSTDPDEHGFGRPWVRRLGSGYELFFSIRKRSLGAYRLGYATSADGIHWIREDSRMGLDVSKSGFDSAAISYSATVAVGGVDFCFYNGNEFGRDGFALATCLQ